MSDLDYETLFNEIAVQTRDKRKTLKEVLDKVFEDDSGRTAEVLADMLRVNEKAHSIEASRPGFMNLMAAMRSVRAVREELLEKVDRLMDEIRRFLALKEEMANDRLEKLTGLFREELGNPQFRFHFHLLDDQELHHLSEVRSNARNESGTPSESLKLPPRDTSSSVDDYKGDSYRPTESYKPAETPADAYKPAETYKAAEAYKPAETYKAPEYKPAESYKAPEPVKTEPVKAYAAPEPEPENDQVPETSSHAAAEAEPSWSSSKPSVTIPEEASWSPAAADDQRPSWLNQSAASENPPTLKGTPPDTELASDHEAPAATALAHEAQPEVDADADGGASPYEVDVDVLRILSEETFRPPKR